MSISGWVFFICTPEGEGGSGRRVIRAVSFFGPTAGEVTGNGGGTGLEAGAPEIAGGGAGGGMNRGGWTGLLGAGGINGLATGGRGAPEPGGVCGGSGGVAGGRVGKVILTVSRPSVDSFAGVGETAMRTVSFLGSVGSAIAQLHSSQRLLENGAFVTA
jgi:hypothetical protein